MILTALMGRIFIFRTTDGGQTIDTFSINGYTDIHNFSVFFLDSNHGWVSCYFDNLYRTNDGGITWQMFYVEPALRNMFFTDTLNGYGLRDGICYLTNDGGQTWQQSYLHEGIMDIEKIYNDYWLCGAGGKISLSADLNEYISFGINFHIAQLSDAVILNDSIHCFAGRQSSHLILTENDSESYIDIATPGIAGHPEKLVFYMENRNHLWIGTDDARILKTTDGGLSWDVMLDLMNTQIAFIDIEIYDSLRGWAIYSKDLNGSYEKWIIRTVDGWQNYTSIEFVTTTWPVEIQFVDSMYGWLCDQGENILITQDGGLSWQNSTLGFYTFGMQFLTSQIGYAYGANCRKTIDGGFTWQPFFIGWPGVNDCHFINENEGWIVKGHIEVLHTFDRGATWTSQFLDYDAYINEIEFFDENYGLFLMHTTQDRTRLFKTYNGGLTWIESESEKSKVSIISCYPNPLVKTN